jgi:energy-coupling factor transport system permease protein
MATKSLLVLLCFEKGAVMRKFSRLQPAAAGIYFLAVIGILMFTSSPVLRLISLIFGVTSAVLMRIFRAPLKDFGFYLLIFAAISLSNPLFVHRGSTPLFYINDRPFTLEALVYGADMALMLISALVWFRIFSQIMTSDKLNALFGRSFSSVAAVMTLVLRYVPTFKRRYYEIRSAQKTAGFLCEDDFFSRVKSELNVFFSLAVSSLELSANTADSMKARGFLLSPHTELRKKELGGSDFFLIILSFLTASTVIFFGISGSSVCEFYPALQLKNSFVCDIFYAFLCAVPIIFEVRERVKWRFCNVKI